MRFSVIIPAYNAEEYIRTAIESCLNQTYRPHEIIVIDDVSNDRTAAVAESFPPPVRVVRLSENMGPAAARNRGIQVSTGDWLAFLDADDWFLPQKLELQRRCALENDRAVLIYAAFLSSLDGVESPARFVPPSKLWPMLRYKCAFHIGTVALRRDAFDAVGGFNPSVRGTEDWDLWLRLAARYSVRQFAAISEPLAVYRTTPGSLSSNAMRMFKERTRLIEHCCLFGTNGLSKQVWRRRILSFMHYDASMALREEGSLHDLPFILASIAFWPLPWNELPLKRYKVAAVMVRQHLIRRLRKLAFKAQSARNY